MTSTMDASKCVFFVIINCYNVFNIIIIVHLVQTKLNSWLYLFINIVSINFLVLVKAKYFYSVPILGLINIG